MNNLVFQANSFVFRYWLDLGHDDDGLPINMFTFGRIPFHTANQCLGHHFTTTIPKMCSPF